MTAPATRETPDHAELARIAYNERRRLDEPKNRKISEALRIPDGLMAEAVRRVQAGESKRGVARSLDIPDSSIRRAMKGAHYG